MSDCGSVVQEAQRIAHKGFSRMIPANAKKMESIAFLAEPHVGSCLRTSTRSAKVCPRTLQILEPIALNLENACLLESWNVGSFRIALRRHVQGGVRWEFPNRKRLGDCKSVRELGVPQECPRERCSLGKSGKNEGKHSQEHSWGTANFSGTLGNTP